jgi:site-specific recombinase
MFITALFTISKLWKQSRCPTTDEWIKKIWYLHTMEFYSAMKKNEILSFSSKWKELENIILSEVSQTHKTKNCMLSLICGLQCRENAAMWLDLGHMTRGENILEVWG